MGGFFDSPEAPAPPAAPPAPPIEGVTSVRRRRPRLTQGRQSFSLRIPRVEGSALNTNDAPPQK
jgi:hypothetical protein